MRPFYTLSSTHTELTFHPIHQGKGESGGKFWLFSHVHCSERTCCQSSWYHAWVSCPASCPRRVPPTHTPPFPSPPGKHSSKSPCLFLTSHACISPLCWISPSIYKYVTVFPVHEILSVLQPLLVFWHLFCLKCLSHPCDKTTPIGSCGKYKLLTVAFWTSQELPALCSLAPLTSCLLQSLLNSLINSKRLQCMRSVTFSGSSSHHARRQPPDLPLIFHSLKIHLLSWIFSDLTM